MTVGINLSPDNGFVHLYGAQYPGAMTQQGRTQNMYLVGGKGGRKLHMLIALKMHFIKNEKT